MPIQMELHNQTHLSSCIASIANTIWPSILDYYQSVPRVIWLVIATSGMYIDQHKYEFCA